MAVLMHAVCHPCVFTWGDKWSPPHPDGYPKMSADFPGEAQPFVEKVYGEPTQALFLQGCAGDIRPNLPGLPYRCGDEADIRWTGRDLGCAVVRAADRTAIREEMAKRPTVYPIKLRVDGRGPAGQGEAGALRAPGAEGRPVPVPDDAGRAVRRVRVPGSRRRSPTARCRSSSATPTAAIGYICTAQAFKEGGYEPNMTPPGAGGRADLSSSRSRAGRPRHRRRLRVLRPEAAGRPQELHPVDPDRDGIRNDVLRDRVAQLDLATHGREVLGASAACSVSTSCTSAASPYCRPPTT